MTRGSKLIIRFGTLSFGFSGFIFVWSDLFRDSEARNIFLALRALKLVNIVHSDLKPDNLLVSMDPWTYLPVLGLLLPISISASLFAILQSCNLTYLYQVSTQPGRVFL